MFSYFFLSFQSFLVHVLVHGDIYAVVLVYEIYARNHIIFREMPTAIILGIYAIDLF